MPIAVVAVIISIIAVASAVVLKPTLRIGAGAVGTNELADDSVTSDKITDGTITDDDIATVGISKIASNAVGSSQIADNSIAFGDLSSDVVDAITGIGEIADNSITSAKIADETITSNDIGTDAVGSDEIASGAVGTDELMDGAVTGEKIASGAVTWGDVVGKPMEVVAAGFIEWDATITENYNIESVTWNSALSFYEISIIGVDYFYSDYVTLVTPAYTHARTATTTSMANKLVVCLFDNVGNKVQTAFQFVTYKVS